MLDWTRIDTVLLDMDGTLLDLYFDNHFWQEHLPASYAGRRGISVAEAQAELAPRFRAVEGTLDWYCLDYWSKLLELDLVALKREVDHLIAVHPYVTDFLQAARALGKRLLLVTNAHRDSLALKMERVALEPYFDAIISAHDYAAPKESPVFWERLERAAAVERERALLIDDSVAVLRAARAYGIAHVVAARRPDSRQPARVEDEFPGIVSFVDLGLTPRSGGPNS